MVCKRYFPPELLNDFYKDYLDSIELDILGYSVKGLPIYEFHFGTGKQKILMWSQMHGNETTTTKALLDLIPWLLEYEQNQILNSFTFYVIPQLNPDGAKAFTRLNANQCDLNRDSIELSQPESKLLRKAYERIAPNYALNLHGQRTIYGAGLKGGPATISFLAPSADFKSSVTPARKIAMSAIASMCKSLQKELTEKIGRYDDTFNPNCVGDSFTMDGTPTILFEAGHYPGDYQREVCRKLVFKAFRSLFIFLSRGSEIFTVDDYLKIPKNTKNYVDLIVSDVDLVINGKIIENQQLAIQYIEELKDGKILFHPSYYAFGSQVKQKAHRYLNLPINNIIEPIPFIQDKIIKNTKNYKLFSINP